MPVVRPTQVYLYLMHANVRELRRLAVYPLACIGATITHPETLIKRILTQPLTDEREA